MKKLFVSIAALSLVFALSSCRDTETNAEDAMNDAENVMEEAADDAARAAQE